MLGGVVARREPPPLFSTASASTAVPPRATPISSSVDVAVTNVGDEAATAGGGKTAATAVPLTFPFASSHQVSIAALLSVPQAASRRSVDPYEACKFQLDHFVEVQDEQGQLIERLQSVLQADCAASAFSASVDDAKANAENVRPGCLPRIPALPQGSMRHPSNPASEDKAQVDVSGATTPSAIVHRLRVLQRESAELASTHCLPTVQHLLSTFDSYWRWKRTHMQSDAEALTARRTPVKSDEGGAAKGMSATSKSSSLRRRYDHAVRVRDELESFLALYAEAVHSLEPHLQQWMTSAGATASHPNIDGNVVRGAAGGAAVQCSTSSQRSASLQQFLLYVQELLEVTQTTRHVAHLLQAALAALCRPSPRKEKESNVTTSSHAVVHRSADETSTSCLHPRLPDNLELRISVPNSDRGVKESVSNIITINAVDGERRRTSQLLASPHASSPAKSGGPRTPTRHGPPSASLPTAAHTMRSTSRCVKQSEEGDASWTAVLSPLTPPRPALPQSNASLLRRDAMPLSVDDDSPPPQRSAVFGPSASSSSLSTSSLSPAAAVSVSPLTVPRHGGGGAGDDCVERSDRQRSRSHSTPLLGVPDDAKRHQLLAAASPPSPPSRWAARDDASFTTAAVSPVPRAPPVMRRNISEGDQSRLGGAAADNSSHSGGSSADRRWLLPELASAQGDDVATGECLASAGVAPQQQQRRRQRRPSSSPEVKEEVADVDAAAAAAAAEAVVYVPLDKLRSASPRSPSVAHAFVEAAGRRQHRSSSTHEDGVTPWQSSGEGDAESTASDVGRAPSVPVSLWPRLMPDATKHVDEATPQPMVLDLQQPRKEWVPAGEEKPPGVVPPNLGAAMSRAPTSTASRGRAVSEFSFYTSSSSTLAGEVEAAAPAVAALPSRAKSTTTTAASPKTTSPSLSLPLAESQGTVAPKSPKVEVEALEREASVIQAQLQRQLSHPARLPSRHRRRRVSPMSSRGPRVELESPFSSPSSLLSSSSSSLSSNEPRRSQTRVARRRSEQRLARAVHRELETLREEQRHSLRRLQHDVRGALDEVVSAATTAVTTAVSNSSRASSRHGTDAERPETEGRAEGNDGDDVRGSEDGGKNTAVGRSATNSRTSAQTTRPSSFSAVTEAEAEAERLRASLAATQARAARLEQLTIQLKKRLWLAEFSTTSAAAQAGGTASTPGECGGKRHLSLRDAFVYGDSTTALDDTLSAHDVDADGALAEERALLYLVDRALEERSARRGGAVLRRTIASLRSPHHSTTPPNTSTAAAAAAGTAASPPTASGASPVKCFDDVCDGASWRRSDKSGTSLGKLRCSPRIRQQRASIFERLRHSNGDVLRPATNNSAPALDDKNGSSNNNSNSSGVGRGWSAPPLSLQPRSFAHSTDDATTPLAARGAEVNVAALPAHPYNSSSTTPSTRREPVNTTSHLRLTRGATSSSNYYAAISSDGGHHHVALTSSPDGAHGSSLRAEQVLQNARRLLQSRSDAHARSRLSHGEECYGNTYETEDERSSRHAVSLPASPPYSYASSVPSAGGVDGSRLFPPPPPPPYAADTVAATSAPLPRSWQGPPQSPQRDITTMTSTTITAAAAVGRTMGGLHSPSSETQYFGYDTSPCSAVAYSTSKLPRPSPHREDTGRDERNACSSVSSSGAVQRHQRVDSATSPVPSPVGNRERSRASHSTGCDEVSSGPSRTSVASATSDDVARASRSRGTSVPRSDETQQHFGRTARGTTVAFSVKSCQSPPPSVARRSRGAGRGSEDDDDEEERWRTPPRGRRELQMRWQESAASIPTRPVSRTASRNTSVSSRGSAQEALLDELNDNESALRRALEQLHTQQQQLREKRTQVALLVDAQGQPTGQRGRRRSHVSGSAGAAAGRSNKTQAEMDKLKELLVRLGVAEAALAEKERRVERAMTALQRQKAALVSDDFL
jgi:trimeric autotransporter adhesin